MVPRYQVVKVTYALFEPAGSIPAFEFEVA